jgi:hypothetical protein
MTLSLEELKQQRAQIQKHLEWLDAQIEAWDSAPNEANITEPREVPAEVSKPQEDDALPEPTTPMDTAEPEIAPTYQAKTQEELLRAKVGCVVLFVLGIALFLFLLFGLPYLL